MESSRLELRPMTPHCGAVVTGVDLARPLAEDVVATLSAALADRGVLCFRDQHMTPDQQKQLGRHFGELHRHPAWPRLLEGHPEIMEIYADENTRRIAGEDWHSDVSCDPAPPMGTILYMLELPPVGGDTLFANMQAVFESLSQPMQRLLEGLSAIHDGETVYRGRYDGVDDSQATFPRSEHPVVCTHPISGQKVLFVNRIFTRRIVQLTQRESDAVLRMLFERVEQPEFQCRLQWQPNTVAFWDNRSAQHHAMWDYYPHRRRGLRVTIKGQPPEFRSDVSDD